MLYPRKSYDIDVKGVIFEPKHVFISACFQKVFKKIEFVTIAKKCINKEENSAGYSIVSKL
jgi:predicted RNA-binding protein